MIIQNRKGFTYQQDDPQDDLFSFDIFQQFLLAPEAQDLKYGQDLNA